MFEMLLEAFLHGLFFDSFEFAFAKQDAFTIVVDELHLHFIVLILFDGDQLLHVELGESNWLVTGHHNVMVTLLFEQQEIALGCNTGIHHHCDASSRGVRFTA